MCGPKNKQKKTTKNLYRKAKELEYLKQTNKQKKKRERKKWMISLSYFRDYNKVKAINIV